MNWYATYKDIEAQAALPAGSASATVMESFLEAASRVIDEYCRRFFYIETATKYFDGVNDTRLKLPDFLSLTAFTADTERDLTWDGETWTANTDYYVSGMSNIHDYPKRFVCLAPSSTKAFVEGDNYYKVVGQWGYGNGTSSPWKTITPTGTVADATGTTLTISGAVADGSLYTGHTLLVESEQMFVTSYTGTGTSVTVERGVNGTTAAAHSSKAIARALYPTKVTQCCKDIVVECFFKRPFIDGQFRMSDGEVAFPRNDDIFFKQLRAINKYVIRAVA